MLAITARLPRVVFVADAPVYGGAEAYIERIVNALAGRYEFSLLTPESVAPALAQTFVRAGHKVLTAPEVGGKFAAASMVKLATAIRGATPDLIHLNLNQPTNCRYATALGSLAAPSLATMHAPGGSDSVTQRINLRLAFSRLDRLIAVSAEIGESMRSLLHLPPEKLAIIPNGVEPTEQVDIRRSPRPLIIGTAGRHAEVKGFDVLIEATRMLTQEGVAVEVVIAGDGPARADLERQAAGLPITFPGWIQEMSPWFGTLDVFALPSRWEGLPFVLLEAMAHGLPCVSTPVGDIATTVGAACMLVPVDDPSALAAALASLQPHDRRADLGPAGRTYVTLNHSTRQMAEQTEAVYTTLLTNNRRIRPLSAGLRLGR